MTTHSGQLKLLPLFRGIKEVIPKPRINKAALKRLSRDQLFQLLNKQQLKRSLLESNQLSQRSRIEHDCQLVIIGQESQSPKRRKPVKYPKYHISDEEIKFYQSIKITRHWLVETILADSRKDKYERGFWSIF